MDKIKNEIRELLENEYYLFAIRAFGIIYLLVFVYVIHFELVRHERPGLDIVLVFREGFFDIFRNPLKIFPIPSSVWLVMGIFLFFYILILSYAAFIARLYRADDKSVVGTEEWLSEDTLAEYNRKFTEPFGVEDNSSLKNMILSRDMRLSMDYRTRRNNNVFVIGGAGTGKSYTLVGPNLMQAYCSYVVTDPSGELYSKYGKFLEYMGYKVKCFNLSHMEKGNHYNPFHYIHSDKDIQILVKTLITNTTDPEKKGGDAFWDDSMNLLLVALISYLFHYTEKENQNFSNIMRLLILAKDEAESDDSASRSVLDMMFDEIAEMEPESFALKQYQAFKLAENKTLRSILITCVTRLQAFSLIDVENLTSSDDIDLDMLGNEKTAVFIIIPSGDKTFNFLAAMMYSQLFQRVYDYSETTAPFTQMVMDGGDNVVRCFLADSPDESRLKAKEAKQFLRHIQRGRIHYNKEFKWYELVSDTGEVFGYRGSEEEAEKFLSSIREGGHVMPNRKQSNNGRRLPIPVRIIADEFANIGKIPECEQRVATMRKYSLSMTIILQSIPQMRKMYKEEWEDIAANCDTTVYLGSGADTMTTEWISKLLGKGQKTVMSISHGGRGGGSVSLQPQGIELFTPAQLRSMPGNTCIVMPRAMYAYKGDKYDPTTHPYYELVNSLGDYYYSEAKTQYLYHSDDMEHRDEKVTAEEVHGGPAVEPSQAEKAVKQQQEEQKEQAAREIGGNRDAENKPVIGRPEPVNGKNRKFAGKVAVESPSGPAVSDSAASVDESERIAKMLEIGFGASTAEDVTDSYSRRHGIA